jgi:hypothetical protein
MEYSAANGVTRWPAASGTGFQPSGEAIETTATPVYFRAPSLDQTLNPGYQYFDIDLVDPGSGAGQLAVFLPE